MKTIMMNMIRIFDGDKVLVLDKKIKYGWEGLTFPGGKVDPGESFNRAAIREAKEETNLDLGDLVFNGIIQWYAIDTGERQTGLLYTCREFTGDLVSENEEGNLFFENYEKFKLRDRKSDTMDDILKIYDGEYFEIVCYFENDMLIKTEYIK